MKITIENLGVFKYAEYELANLTIICGKNNTGKTYATYALYGFLDFFKRGYIINIAYKKIAELLDKGSMTFSLDLSQELIDQYVNEACKIYQNFLPKIFSAQDKYFKDTKIHVKIDVQEIKIPEYVDEVYKTQTKDVLRITKEKGRNELIASLLLKGEEYKNLSTLRANISRILGETLKNVIFNSVLNDCFLASAERTGAVVFKDELNFEKNTLLREIASLEDFHVDDILNKVYNITYPLPVRRNIDFIRNLENISKEEGELSKKNPCLMEKFNDITGGTYKVSKEGIYYYPTSKKTIKLTIGESASSVRSLLDMYFYLKYLAKPGDVFMIDEPELNLHPESQRKLARVLALLVNLGVKVFITTHSDYIIKEFNTLIMLFSKSENENVIKFLKESDYNENEMLSPTVVKMYTSEKKGTLLPNHKRKVSIQTLVPAEIDSQYGIIAKNFDDTNEKMNQIQEFLMFS